MNRIFISIALLSSLTGCGIAGTGAAAAAGGVSEVQEAQQAKETEEHVRQQLDAAQQQAARQRDDAEKQNQ